MARLARLKFPEGRDGDIAVAVAATRAIAASAYPFDEQAVRQMAARDQVSGVRDTAAQSRQAGAKWHGGRLSQLRVPALVLHGSDDPLLRPAAARRTAKAISGARLVILPGVGHYLPAEVYPQVARRSPGPRRPGRHGSVAGQRGLISVAAGLLAAPIRRFGAGGYAAFGMAGNFRSLVRRRKR